MCDELVKQLRDFAVELRKAEDALLVRDAADAIENMCEMVSAAYGELANVEADKPRWVPVTEQPPFQVGDEGYTGYLVYADGYCKVADYAMDKYDNIPFFHVDGEYEPNVTHWRTLPLPPKEE